MVSKILPTAKKLAIAVFAMLVCDNSSLAQTNVTIYATGAANSFKTGSVNSGGTKNDGHMVTINSGANRGWAVFDLSTLPAGAVISAATVKFTTYTSTLSTANNNIYGFTGDPATMAGAALYTACGAGTTFNNTSWTANALQTKVLAAAGLTFLNNSVGNANTCLSFVRGSTNTYNIYGYGAPTTADQPQLDLTYTVPPTCNAAPTAGTAAATVANACIGVPFGLNLTGNTTGVSSLAIQWQTRVGTSGPWSNISGATTASATVASQSAASQYRAYIRCVPTNQADTSNVISVGQNTFLNCYCASSANSNADDDIGQVIIGSLTNPANYGTLLSNASSSNIYTDFTGLPATNLNTGAPIPVNITQIQQTANYYPCHLKIYIDIDHNGQFDANESYFSQDGPPTTLVSPTFSGNMTIPTSALPGLTRMRIILWEAGTSATVTPCVSGNTAYGYGETEDYMVNIVAAAACSGTPTAGTAAASVSTTCAAVPFNLTLTGNTTGLTGLSIQWQTRVGTSGPWSNISGATNNVYTVPNQSAASQYRAYISCSNGGLGDTSNAVLVGQNAPLACYCTPVYTNTPYGCSGDDNINDFTLAGEDGTAFNDLATGCSVNAYDNRTAQTPVKLGQGSTYSGTISSVYGSSQFAKVWIDFNDNGVFESSDSVGVISNITTAAIGYTIKLPANATLGNHRMRIRLIYFNLGNPNGIDPCASYTFGETHDYTVTVILGNDNGRGAIAVNVGAACTGNAYTNAGSSQGTTEPFGNCSATTGTNTVWYKFVAPASGFVKITTDFAGSVLTDTRVSLFSATDSSNYTTYSLISCDDDNGTVSTYMSTIFANGLTPNTTYYIQVDRFDASTTSGAFCLEVREVNNTMLQSTSASCSAGLAPYGTTAGYTAWTTLVNSSGQLIAMVRNTGTGTTAGGYSGRSVTINTAAIRQNNSVPYLDRNFLINNTSTGPYEVIFPFLSTELTALTTAAPGTTLANLKVTRQSGTTCAANFGMATGTNTVITPTATGNANGVAWVRFNTTGFSNFYLNGLPAPLSIDLKTISASNVGERNRVDWTTASEDKGDVFEIERSTDGENFERIGISKANGTASEYVYWDAAPFSGTNYYRLKLVNIDGSESYTQVVTALVKSGTAFTVNAYPNPVKDVLTVKILGEASGNGQVIISDVTGKVVRSVVLTADKADIDMSGLTNGVYMVRYTDNTHTQTIKINKQ